MWQAHLARSQCHRDHQGDCSEAPSRREPFWTSTACKCRQWPRGWLQALHSLANFPQASGHCILPVLTLYLYGPEYFLQDLSPHPDIPHMLRTPCRHRHQLDRQPHPTSDAFTIPTQLRTQHGLTPAPEPSSFTHTQTHIQGPAGSHSPSTLTLSFHTPTHAQALSYSSTHVLTHLYTLTFTLFQPHTHSHTYPHSFLTLLSHTHSQSHMLIYPHSHMLTLTLTYTHSLIGPYSHTPAPLTVTTYLHDGVHTLLPTNCGP
jgi:hypothetical protein